MHLAYSRNGIAIFFKDVGSRITVVTFASLRDAPTPIPLDEFHAELSVLVDRRGHFRPVNIITVADTSRRYYLDGNAQHITREVNWLLRRLGTKKTVTLGLSMGAFAAVAYAARIYRCSKAIAFSPHSSISPAVVPFDTRSRAARAQIRTWDVLDGIDELQDHVEHNIYFGDADETDTLHLNRFQALKRKNLSINIAEGHNHYSYAFHWMQNKTMPDILSELILEPPHLRRSLSDLLRRAPAAFVWPLYFTSTRTLLRSRKTEPEAT